MGTVSNGDGQANRTYVDPATSFSIEIPQGWLIDTSGRQGTKLILLHPIADDHFRTNLNVIVSDNPVLTVEEYLTMSRLQLMQLARTRTLEVDEPAALPGGGHLFEWISPVRPIPLKGRQMLLFGPEKVYVITGTALLPKFESHRRDLELALGSFRLPAAELR